MRTRNADSVAVAGVAPAACFSISSHMARAPRPIDLVNLVTRRGAVTSAEGLAYGRHPRQRLDIYRPQTIQAASAGGAGLPVLIFFYGGAWQMGERRDFRFIGRRFARLGFLVVVADYRLYPEIRFPDFIADAADATAWIAHHAAEFGGDPDAIFVAGHSAGAYLALMLALAPTYLTEAGFDRQRLAGAIGLAGPYDFLPLTGPVYQKIFTTDADLADTQPISFADGDAPPCLLLTGARDRVVAPANTASLAERLRSAGAIVETKIYPRLGHVGMLLAVLGLPGLAPAVAGEIADFAAFCLDADGRPADRTRMSDMAR